MQPVTALSGDVAGIGGEEKVVEVDESSLGTFSEVVLALVISVQLSHG